VEPTLRAQPARGEPATDLDHGGVATQRLLLPTTGPISTSRRRPPTSPTGSGPVRTRPGPAHRSLGYRRRCGGPACDVRPGGYPGPYDAGQRPGAPPWRPCSTPSSSLPVTSVPWPTPSPSGAG